MFWRQTNQDFNIRLVDVKNEKNNGLLAGVSLPPSSRAPRVSLARKTPFPFPFKPLPRRLFCPLHPLFWRLASRGQYQDVRALIFQIKQTYCNYRSQSNLLYIIFYISWKNLGILNLVSEFKIWNTISYCLLLFQQQWKSKNDCLSVELAVFSYNLGGNSKTVPFTF